MASIDLTIRGAGVFGLSIAWIATTRGARVQVVDPFGPAAGSSGGLVGALAPHVPENWTPMKAFQLDSLLMAERFWAGVDATGGGASGYARKGRLQPLQDDRALALAHQRTASAKDLWQNHARWEVIAATGVPWEPASPSGHLIHDTLSALVHPRKACDALVKALATRGVTVMTEAEDAGQTLWATGLAGLHALSAENSRSTGNGVKGQAALLAYDARGAPQLFGDGVHIIPHQDGTVAIGSTTERDFDMPDQTDHQLDDVITAARSVLPALQDAPVIGRWAGVRPRSRSRSPMLGGWPGKADHYIANGGFKTGFGMAPKVAHVMVDLMLERIDNIPQGFHIDDNL